MHGTHEGDNQAPVRITRSSEALFREGVALSGSPLGEGRKETRFPRLPWRPGYAALRRCTAYQPYSSTEQPRNNLRSPHERDATGGTLSPSIVSDITKRSPRFQTAMR